jgi:hypothetical protein
MKSRFLIIFLLAAGLSFGPDSARNEHRPVSGHGAMQPHRNDDGSHARDARHVGQSDNWSGYTVSKYQTGVAYTAMQGSWTVPTATSSMAGNARSWEYSSSWIGIGGSCEDSACATNDSTLIQLGTEQDVYSDGTTSYYPWYEMLPADSVTIPHTVSPGDAITASIVCTAACSASTQTWTITMTDVTAGWTYSNTTSYAASELSAEWIEEATSTCSRRNCTIAALADFGQVTFTQSSANGANPNFTLANDGVELTDTYGQTANPSAPSGGNAFSVCWGMSTFTPCTYTSGASPLVAAVLPGSRSVEVGGAATAFATVINSGTTAATGCGISSGSNVSAGLTFQTTDSATNATTGAADATVGIPSGGTQSFLIALSPTATIAPTNVALLFGCENANPAPIEVGIDTLLLSASTTATPDLVALSATSADDGILHISGSTGVGAFAVATVNLGSAATITAKANTGSESLPVALTICQTVPSTGVCMATPASSVLTTIAAEATPTFAVFATATNKISFLPQTNRVFVQFSDATGAIRGETSVAVETQ